MQVPGITLAQCQTKWKNLRYAFIKFEESKRTTGAGRQIPPSGYEIMSSFLLTRPIVHPHTVSSALPPTISSGQHLVSVSSPVPSPSPLAVPTFPEVTLTPVPSTRQSSSPSASSIPQATQASGVLDDSQQPTSKRSGTGGLPPRKRKIRPPSQSQRLEATYKDVSEAARSSSAAFLSLMTKYTEEQKANMENSRNTQAELLETMKSIAETLKTKAQLLQESEKCRAKEHQERMDFEKKKIRSPKTNPANSVGYFGVTEGAY